MALGLLLGQTAGVEAGATGALLALAAAGAAPALMWRHRALGVATVLATAAAVVGAGQGWHTERTRELRFAGVASGPAELRGRIVAVRVLQGRAGKTGAMLDVQLAAPAGGVDTGERVRVSTWSSAREWRVGEHVVARVSALHPPRGFCNDGVDGFARAAWRRGVVATASVASDRMIRLDASKPVAGLDVRLHDARVAIRAAVVGAVPDPAVHGILLALIYGDQSSIPDQVRDAYARTGTAHVLSVSGLHLAVVATTAFVLGRLVLVRVPWLALRVLVVRPAALLALVPASLYALLSGGAVATLRSLAMAALVLGGIGFLRRPDPWTALAAASIVLCLLEPGIGADPSFQLSFAAVAALVLAGERLVQARARRTSTERPGLVGRLRDATVAALVASLAAGAMTAPITAYHFGSVALLGVVANLIVVPLVGSLALLLALGGAALLPVAPDLGTLALVAASWCIVPANALVERLATMPGCAVDLAIASPRTVVWMLVLVSAGLAGGRARRRLMLVAAVLAALDVGAATIDRSSRALVVRFLDVGQGDATLVELPESSGSLLVDAGGLGGRYDPGQRVVVPALRRAGITGLDAVVLSHSDFDHYGGLAAVVRAVRVARFWTSGDRSSAATYAELLTTLEVRGVPRIRLARGAPLDPLARWLRVLHPPRDFQARSHNDASLVLQLTFGATRVLLPGDVEADAEQSLLRAGGLSSTVVKVPHHGSRTSSTRPFVYAIRPTLAVALAGARNRFGFPARQVEARWLGAGAAWRRTDRDGAVVLRSDGQLEQVESCR